MKSTKMFPFERNHYYYGKLLSVEDFNLEQEYSNNKQRMNHMFLSGSGIVAGLNVVSIGEQTISVETGCALDAFGREMAVYQPVTRKLQLIDGFEQATAKGENYIYLCMEYDEKPADPVYNVAGSSFVSQDTKENAYNKITESFRLFCTNREPELNGVENEGLFREKKQLFRQKGVVIHQSMPKYIELGKKAVMQIEIESTEKNSVAFSFQMNLNGLTYEKENRITVHFDELLVEKAEHYTLTYELEAVAAKGYQASAMVEPDSFRVILNQQQRPCSGECKYSMEIVEDDIKERIMEDYYKNNMDSLIEKARQKYIYLAKIYLLKASDAYQIDKIINAPAKQYVMSQVLLGTLQRVMMKDLLKLEAKLDGQNGQGSSHTEKQKKQGQIEIAQGVYEMELGLRGQNHSRFFSPPIAHGLGLGYVTIVLSQETKKNELVFGNPEIFDENYVDASLAASLDETTGSFVIGARLNETVAKKSIRIKWTAIRKAEVKTEEKLEHRISIKPGMLELYTRESACLEVGFYNMDDRQITWHVKEGGGSVDETNVYTAPNEKGVYEIVAKSVAYPDVKASIFAVVRERE